MVSKFEQELLKLNKNLEVEEKEKLIERYLEAEQIKTNAYDSYNYFRMLVFKDLIYKDIETKEELLEAMNKVRLAFDYLNNELTSGFSSEITHLKNIDIPDEEVMKKIIRRAYLITSNRDSGISMMEQLMYSIINKINIVDYRFFNNLSLRDQVIKLIEPLEQTILGLKDSNGNYQLEEVIYNLKNSIKLSFGIYEA